MENKKKARLGVLDAVLIVALIVCLVAAGFAFVFKRTNGEVVIRESDKEDYVISFECYEIMKGHAGLLKDGDVFYLPDNTDFGKLSGKVTITPAVVYTEREDGTILRTYAPENGDNTKVDVSGTIMASGARDKKGVFVIGENFRVVPGESFIMHSSTVSVRVMITSIEKVAQ